MPTTKDVDMEAAENLRRGASAAAKRGLLPLAEMLRQRASEIEAALPPVRRVA